MQNKLKSHAKINNIAIESTLTLTKHKMLVVFVVKGALLEYFLPKIQKLKRADELWKATCFELLLANDDEVYYELNFSSSLAWNFYVLNSYRTEPKAVALLEEPSIHLEEKNDTFYIRFEFSSTAFNFEKFKYYNMATILLTKENKRTFWAIQHLHSQPDFHDKKSFLEIK